MKKIKTIWRKTSRWFYITISLSTVAFIFQACYGTPRDYKLDILIEGSVKSNATNELVKGIKVSVKNLYYDFTDNEGRFTVYAPIDTIYKLRFEDVDSTENGTYLSKDTVLREIHGSVFLDVKLDAK